MTNHNEPRRFLQAIFPDHAQHAMFANACYDPVAKKLAMWEHFRNVKWLDSTRDCFMSPAAFANDGIAVRTSARAIEVRALVIDDVGGRIPPADVLRGLGKPPTFEILTSEGNAHWWYLLAKPVPAAEWRAFFAEIERRIGYDLDGAEPHHVFRLPMGVNTKLRRNGFKPRISQTNPNSRLDAGEITLFAQPAPANPSSDGGGCYAYRNMMWLAEVLPNPDSLLRKAWVDKGYQFKALATDDAVAWQAFDAWSRKNETWYDGDATEKLWRGLKPKKSGRELLIEIEALDPEGYRAWITREAQTTFDDGVLEAEPPRKPASHVAPHVLASGEFVAGFISPDYLVKKLITKAFLYSLTGQTGAGKTSITLRLAATVACGASFGGLSSRPCRVLYLAAENPVDIQMRWIALGAEMGFDVDVIQVFFVKGWFKIGATMKELRAEALRVGGEFGLVVVDTGPVFFEGEDANDRVAQLRHARMMRKLIEVIPGRPTVVVNVHPVKNAGPDNLLPSGGGSFLNEVDGNLTAAKNEDQTIELSWQGKWRGVEFAPLYFLLKTATHPRLIDSDGEAMPTVVCEHLSADAKEVLEQAESADQVKILAEMMRKPRSSLAELAIYMGWYFPCTGKPAKSKMARYVKTLTQQKLVKKHLQVWVVTGAATSKSNGGGGSTVPDVLVRHGTIGTKEY